MSTPRVDRPGRSTTSLVHRLQLVRLALVVLLAGAAMAAVALSRAVPGTATSVLETVVVAYAVLSGVPMWLVMGRLIRSVVGSAGEYVAPQLTLAPVIPLHAYRQRVS